MARVIRAVTVSRKHSHAGGQTEVYPSLNSLRSLQNQDDKQSCGDWFLSGLRAVYNFTIASCECVVCCFRDGNYNQAEDTTSIEDEEVQHMKEKLNFHFQNPFQKWTYSKNRRFPWKLLVQIISIILVTLQLVLFAKTKFALNNFLEENQSTFTRLFVKNPAQPDGDDPLPSPINTLYTHADLQEQVEFTINQFFTLDDVALGSYGYGWTDRLNRSAMPALMMTTRKYNESCIDPATKIYFVSENIIIVNQNFTNSSNHTLDWTKIRAELSQTIDFTLQFEITSIFISKEQHLTDAQCFQFSVMLLIKNKVANGNMPLELTVTPSITKCNEVEGSSKMEGVTATTVISNTGTTILDVFVMIFGVISILQCSRSLFRALKLSREVYTFFKTKFDYHLKCHQILPLYNMWFVGAIISNLLVIIGCVMKLLVSYNVVGSLSLVDFTSIVIGLAVFGQWCGLLRFLSYLDKYNILLITLRLSLPSVLRFIICTGILYIAFLLCGWLVLGPYHPKFRDPFTTSDCLFSLINGDDMFATYSGMSVASTPVFVFSKIYLYIFIGLFIYVVLSVFISLISDTYETLHEHWYERSKGLLIDFASGKLNQVHCGQTISSNCRRHSHTDLLHHNDEEDYQYIREASNLFVVTSEANRRCPGNAIVSGDSAEQSKAAPGNPDKDNCSFASQNDLDEVEWTGFMRGNSINHVQFPNVQIQNLGPGKSDT